MLVLACLTIVSLCGFVFGAPTSNIPITKIAGKVKPNSYIVRLKRGVSSETHLKGITRVFSSGSNIKYKYQVVSGYSAMLSPQDLNNMRRSKDIESIEQDLVMTLQYTVSNDTQEVEEFDFEPRAAAPRPVKGAGVDIYSLDTGINIAHVCFGGRARWGPVFGGYARRDGNGHGTHTAATAACNYVGIANGARVIGVKVTSDYGTAATSDVIAGLNWVYRSFKHYRRPAVAIMSLGSGANPALDRAVYNAVAGGLHIAAAAGNTDEDALKISPARGPGVVTVGAVDRRYRKAFFSNHGPRIDIQALGVDVKSAWFDGPKSVRTISGTSMAAPYVAGVLAAAISKHKIYHPIVLKRELKRHGRAVCTGQPGKTTRLLATEW